MEEARATQAPVPAPPIKPLVAPRAVQQASTCRGREHEVQRLIRDLAALAASRRGSAA
ncbi:hypothetical protein [Pseudarthrobacter oxydans]|uniref:hypothetical protein n=1 Tax=Pseudarthrobacter oxydans TaxID=1671 RepID=UPI00344D44B8